jgi:ABC-2 type transport system permease protein
VFQLPGALRTASAFTPNGWALRAFSDLVALGGGVASVVRPVAALASFGLVTGAVALTRARKLELV